MEEKDSERILCFEVPQDANKVRGQAGRREAIQGEGGRGPHHEFRWQDAPPRPLLGNRSDWKKAYVTLKTGEKVPDFAGVLSHGDQNISADNAHEALPDLGRAAGHHQGAVRRSRSSSPRSAPAGRNSTGRVTVRCIGGGHKQAYRVVDFKRDKHDVPAVVAAIEYDPNRSARLALLNYKDGEKRYILAPEGLKVGMTVISGDEADILVGNALPLRTCPSAPWCTTSSCSRARAGRWRGGRRAAQLVAREGGYWRCSGCPPARSAAVLDDCYATVGQVGNLDHENVSSARPAHALDGQDAAMRGVVMNPVDHPHGGGEGKTSGGRHPVTPWGQPTRGFKTRNNKRTDKWIVSRKSKKR